jgi:O-antigen/teichoic acid export membrane protein
MNFKDLISSNQLYALLAKGIEGLKIIVINAFVARYYGPELFGKYTFIISILSVIAIIAEFRLQSVLIKEYSRNDFELKVLLGSGLLVNIFFAVVGFTLVYLYTVIEDDPIVATGMLIYGLSFFYKIPRLLRGFFVSIEKNIIIAKCEILSSFLTISLLCFFIYNDFSIEYILLGRSIDFLFISILFIIFFYSYRQSEFKISASFKVSKYLILKSAPLVLSGAAMILFQRVDIILIREYMGDYQAGLYGSAANIMTLFSLVPLVLSESLAPKIFKEIGSEYFDEMRFKFSVMVISVGGGLSLLMCIFSYPLIYMFYGESYLSSWSTLLVLSLSPLLIALGSVAGQLIVADNSQNWAYIKSIIGCAATIISNLILIPVMGLKGAAISTLVGLVIANFLAHYFIPAYRNIFFIQCRSLKALLIPLSKNRIFS